MQSGLAHFCVFQLCVADLAIFYFGRTIWFVNETYYAKSHDILMEDALESRIRTKSTQRPQYFFRKKKKRSGQGGRRYYLERCRARRAHSNSFFDGLVKATLVDCLRVTIFAG